MQFLHNKNLKKFGSSLGDSRTEVAQSICSSVFLFLPAAMHVNPIELNSRW